MCEINEMGQQVPGGKDGLSGENECNQMLRASSGRVAMYFKILSVLQNS